MSLSINHNRTLNSVPFISQVQNKSSSLCNVTNRTKLPQPQENNYEMNKPIFFFWLFIHLHKQFFKNRKWQPCCQSLLSGICWWWSLIIHYRVWWPVSSSVDLSAQNENCLVIVCLALRALPPQIVWLRSSQFLRLCACGAFYFQMNVFEGRLA